MFVIIMKLLHILINLYFTNERTRGTPGVFSLSTRPACETNRELGARRQHRIVRETSLVPVSAILPCLALPCLLFLSLDGSPGAPWSSYLCIVDFVPQATSSTKSNAHNRHGQDHESIFCRGL